MLEVADVAIRQSATAACPTGYTVKGAQEILPKSVSASLNGAAAAAAWMPCLQILDPGGNIMFSAVSSVSVAAGASADVSWFPRVSGIASGSTQALVGARIQATSSQSIPNNTNTDLVYQQVYFDTDGMTNLGSDARKLTVNTAGIYLVTCATVWDFDSPSAGRRLNAALQNGFYSGAGVPDQFSVVDERMPIWAGTIPPTPRTTNLAVGVFKAVAGDFFASGVNQSSGASATCNGYAFAFLAATLIGS